MVRFKKDDIVISKTLVIKVSEDQTNEMYFSGIGYFFLIGGGI